MSHTQTIDAPRVSVTVEEPADELTQKELERGIELLRALKRGDIALMLGQRIKGGLYLKGAARLL